MGSYWREVFDFSDAAQTPTRLKAGVQVCAALGVIALAVMVAVGFTAGWSSTSVIILGGLALFGGSQSAGQYYQLRRARHRSQSRSRRQSRPRRAQDSERS